MDNLAQGLLARFREFSFPSGENAARDVTAIRYVERGEMCLAPGAKWTQFTSEQEIDACVSRFRWTARYKGGRLGTIQVTDAYEKGHGRLVVKLGGLIPVKNMQGPELDKGELQRYLASILVCPPIAARHAGLEWSALDAKTLRVRDTADASGASVELEFGADGRPVGCRAERPMLVGNVTTPTRWTATCGEFREFEGIRVATRLGVSWHPPAGQYDYYRGEIVSLIIVRQ